MKNLAIILTLTLSMPHLSIAQNLTTDSDTTYWIKNHIQTLNQMRVEPLYVSDNKVIFRYFDGFRLVQLVEDDNQRITSEAHFILQEYLSPGRIYTSKAKLSEEFTKEIINLLDDLSINQIPSDKYIDGWNGGHDGITFFFETWNKNEYSFKTYWTPQAYDDIKEARLIEYFISLLLANDELEAVKEKFMKHQPFDVYLSNLYGIGIVMEN